MLFWTIFALAVFALSYSNSGGDNKVTKSQYVAIALMVCVSIFRFDIGWDYPAYYRTAMGLHDYNYERIELLNQRIYDIVFWADWPPLLFIIYGLITYYLVFTTLKKYSGHLFVALCTYLAFFYVPSFGIIRQAVAVAIVLYAYRYMKDFNYLKYAIAIVIAYLFHSSAIVCLVIPLIYRYMNFKLLAISTVVAFVVFQALAQYLITALGYDGYVEMGFDTLGGGSLIKFAYIMLYISLLLLYHFSPKKDKETERLLYISIFGILSPFLFGGHLGGRMAEYFLVFFCLAIPRILRQYSTMIRAVYSFTLVAYFIVYMHITTLNPIKEPFTPYQTIFTIDADHPKFKVSKSWLK